MMVLQYFLYQKGDKTWIKLLVAYLCVSPLQSTKYRADEQSMNWVITVYCTQPSTLSGRSILTR